MIRKGCTTPLKDKNANFMLKQPVRAKKNNAEISNAYINLHFV